MTMTKRLPPATRRKRLLFNSERGISFVIASLLITLACLSVGVRAQGSCTELLSGGMSYKLPWTIFMNFGSDQMLSIPINDTYTIKTQFCAGETYLLVGDSQPANSELPSDSNWSLETSYESNQLLLSASEASVSVNVYLVCDDTNGVVTADVKSDGDSYVYTITYNTPGACSYVKNSKGLMIAYLVLVSTAIASTFYYFSRRHSHHRRPPGGLLKRIWPKYPPSFETAPIVSDANETEEEELILRIKSLVFIREKMQMIKMVMIAVVLFTTGFYTDYYSVLSYCVFSNANPPTIFYCIVMTALVVSSHVIKVPSIHISTFVTLTLIHITEIAVNMVSIFVSTGFPTQACGDPSLSVMFFIAYIYNAFTVWEYYIEGAMFDLVYSVETNNIGSENVSIFTALLAWLPPVGPIGFHRYYTNNYFTAVVFTLTGGVGGIGWIIDGFLLKKLVKHANRMDFVRITLPLKMKEGTQINEKFAKCLFFLGGVFGLHRFYIGGAKVLAIGMIVMWNTVSMFMQLRAFWSRWIPYYTIVPFSAQMGDDEPYSAQDFEGVFVGVWIQSILLLLFLIVDYWQLPKLIARKNAFLKGLELIENKKDFIQNIGRHQAEWIIKDEDIQLGECIGSGGTAAVFKGRWSNLEVAVKRMHTTSALEEQNVIKEAELHSKLVHENVLRLYGVCLQPLSFVMEYMHNGSLMAFLAESKFATVITPKTILNIAKDIACGMCYLHGRNLLHRDLKSLNILISRTLQAKVADFGEARKRASTMTFQVGTVRWASPDQLFSNHYTEKADVWSYGVILWELYQRLGKGSYVLPYDDCQFDFHVIKRLERKEYLTAEEYFPTEIKELIASILTAEESSRPTFDTIHRILSDMF